MKIDKNELMALLQVIVNFDFNRVRKCMEALGITWELPIEINSERSDWPKEQMTRRVPTDIEMHNLAHKILFKAMYDELASVNVNGIEARFDWTDEKRTKFEIGLFFIPEDITISATKTGITPIEKPEEAKENENDKK